MALVGRWNWGFVPVCGLVSTVVVGFNCGVWPSGLFLAMGDVDI